LIRFDRLAQGVVADLQIGHLRHLRRILDSGDLLVAPLFERLWRSRVVAVTVDDHREFQSVVLR
jgi:hypothetical protein